MTERWLQVTYRKGRTFAAYLHLSHPTGEKSERTVASPDGLLIVDYAVSGRPLGVEIAAPQAVPLEPQSAPRGAWRAAPRGTGLQAGAGRIGQHRSARSSNVAYSDQADAISLPMQVA
jgi:hypothetical protein